MGSQSLKSCSIAPDSNGVPVLLIILHRAHRKPVTLRAVLISLHQPDRGVTHTLSLPLSLSPCKLHYGLIKLLANKGESAKVKAQTPAPGSACNSTQASTSLAGLLVESR